MTERGYAAITPKLAQLSSEVLFGDVWARPGLSNRDRSLITVAALVTACRPQQMPYHMNLAIENGVTVDELSELITHLAFYAGWPSAVTSAQVLADLPAAGGGDAAP